MTDLQFSNEAAHGIGECPGCGADIHVVGSAAENLLRWCCLGCQTVGSAPFAHAAWEDGDDGGESEDAPVIYQ